MRLLGFEITRTKASVPAMNPTNSSSLIPTSGTGSGWWRLWPIVREPFAGAWQQNQEIRWDSALSFAAVYACVTLIAGDISKMRLRLVLQDADGIWNETENPAFSPLLRKPNHYQTPIEFICWWMVSKLVHGNTYALKFRDNRGVVTGMSILDPCRVRVLVAPDTSVFYALSPDNLSGLEESVVVPASEIAHDKYKPLFHPLVGLSPLFACSLAALQGLKIQNNSTNFFTNGGQPGGMLLVPGAISQETADRLKLAFDTNFTGDNAGKLLVLGDGMKYEQMAPMKAVDAQLIEQLRWTGEDVCRAFHVPSYMIDVGKPPNFNNIEALSQQYYSQCLQTLIEELESTLDKAIGLAPDKINGVRMGVEFDLDDLLRMDQATMMAALENGKNYYTPNEGRKKLNLKPVEGGDVVFRQQQDFSLEALNKRDSQPDPFATDPAPAPSAPEPAPEKQMLVKHLDVTDMAAVSEEAALEELEAA